LENVVEESVGRWYTNEAVRYSVAEVFISRVTSTVNPSLDMATFSIDALRDERSASWIICETSPVLVVTNVPLLCACSEMVVPVLDRSSCPDASNPCAHCSVVDGADSHRVCCAGATAATRTAIHMPP